MQRREVLRRAFGGLAVGALGWQPARAAGGDQRAAASRVSLAAAWRGALPSDPQQLGVLDVDAAAQRVEVRWARTLPGRAHGLLAAPGGGVIALATRPGEWLLHCDARGAVIQHLNLANDHPTRWLDGHAVLSLDGAHLFTTETDRHTGHGWIGVRDARSLRSVDAWPTHGRDPHHLLLDAQGHVMVANGGVQRGPDGRKTALDQMVSSLVRLDGRTGALLGQWQLPDARLSVRHLAWSWHSTAVQPLLGIALQAEHDDPLARAQAPVLALWTGQALQVPSAAADAGGYAGDIAASPDGGFVLSALRQQLALRWQPDDPAALSVMARVREPGALAASSRGEGGAAVWLAAARGVGRWHPDAAAEMVAWPQAMALDNHWVALSNIAQNEAVKPV